MRLNLLVFVPFFLILRIAVCTVLSPSNLQYKVEENATFMWNTTQNRIVELRWGLYDPSLNDASPVFISGNINAGVKNVNLTNTAASSYAGRVKYIGDLARGHAWFTLSKLTKEDAGVYVASIREQGNATTSPFPVNLTVSEVSTTAPPSTKVTTTENQTTTTTTPKLQTSASTSEPTDKGSEKKGLSGGAKAGIATGGVLGCCGVAAGIFCCVKKKKDQKKPTEQPDKEMNKTSPAEDK